MAKRARKAAGPGPGRVAQVAESSPEPQADRARLAEALVAVRRVLSRGGPTIDQWRLDARAAIQRLDATLYGSKAIDPALADWSQLVPLAAFVNEELSCYLLGTASAPLPAPASWLEMLDKFARDFGGVKLPIRRRATKPRKPIPLTPRQAEVIQIVGELKGDIAAAARKLGRDRKTVDEIYKAGMKKLGKEAVRHKTRTLARDRRGQDDIADGDDCRRR